ncbi:MAG: transcriptional coactivator p15/PC4 family protein [Elusimicrobiota bacterium]
MANDRVIETFAKNARETVRVMLTTFQKRELLDIRSCIQGENELVPTKKGITISIDLIPKLKEALEKAEAEIKAARK